ncbi:MAG: NAD-dependent succinate-semialdehyde dehydrogenase [Bacillota bacterium]|nr:MAG: NAD-dependent succinate-semialdehyde dehydrogenase [Bacillota bacterium]
MHEVRLLIDGAWTEGEKKEWVDVIDPSTEEPMGRASLATDADVDRAVAAAHRAFPEWSQTAPSKRAAILRQAAALARERLDTLAEMLTLEQGKPLREAKGEIKASIDALEYYAEEARRIYGEVMPTDQASRRSIVIKQPVGPVAAIGPWNYPVLLLAWKVAPALAAGCTVVAKPPTITPLAVTHFLGCLQDAGLPAGVLNVVIGRGRTVGDRLVRHRLIRKISFTGETETGKTIMKAAADGMKRISLELGGHCPLIVFPDADVATAAKAAAYRAFRNMGQICNAVNRIYVHRSIYSQFVEAMVEEARRLRIGRGLDDLDLGPMTTRDGLEKTMQHVEDARSKGARVVYGGQRPDDPALQRGYFYLPTVLVDVDHSMRVSCEETFGPVAPIMTFDTLDEAIRLANDTPYGLVAYLFTNDLATAIVASERLEAGTVGVNNVAGGEVPFPYGGWKESGFGIELSHHGLDEYLLIKHVRVDFFRNA